MKDARRKSMVRSIGLKFLGLNRVRPLERHDPDIHRMLAVEYARELVQRALGDLEDVERGSRATGGSPR